MDKRILLVAVNYNAAEETIAFVQSLANLQQSNLLQLVIVENTNLEFRNGLLEQQLVSIFPDILFVVTPFNKNYVGSVNYALEMLQLKPVDFDFFVISNVDILIPDPSFIEKLLAFEQKEVGIIAPSVFSVAAAVDQNPYKKRRFKRNYFYYYQLVYWHLFFTRAHEALADLLRAQFKHKQQLKQAPKAEYIYAPHGAFMIFLKPYFEKGCSIDYGDLLFCEEIFVAEECIKKGLKVYYEPSLQVLHAEHIAVGVIPGDHIRKLKLRSIQYFLKHF